MGQFLADDGFSFIESTTRPQAIESHRVEFGSQTHDLRPESVFEVITPHGLVHLSVVGDISGTSRVILVGPKDALRQAFRLTRTK